MQAQYLLVLICITKMCLNKQCLEEVLQREQNEEEKDWMKLKEKNRT